MLLHFVFRFKNSMAQTPSLEVNGRPAGLVLPTDRGTQRHLITLAPVRQWSLSSVN